MALQDVLPEGGFGLVPSLVEPTLLRGAERTEMLRDTVVGLNRKGMMLGKSFGKKTGEATLSRHRRFKWLMTRFS